MALLALFPLTSLGVLLAVGAALHGGPKSAVHVEEMNSEELLAA